MVTTSAVGRRPSLLGGLGAGIGFAVLGHLATVVLGAVGVAHLGPDKVDYAGAVVYVLLIQVPLYVVSLAAAFTLLARGHHRIGLGLIVGWSAGTTVFPMLGWIVVVVVLNTAIANS